MPHACGLRSAPQSSSFQRKGTRPNQLLFPPLLALRPPPHLGFAQLLLLAPFLLLRLAKPLSFAADPPIAFA